jgi:MYXO-CTERM domain-containing protein
MLFSTKNLIATSLVLLISAPAFAGASLDTLLGGGSLVSNNGKLVFSDFSFTPIQNAPASSNIEIITLDSGLLFGTPIFTASATGIIDFDIAYKVSAIDSKIVSARMQSTGSGTGTGAAGIFKVIEDANGQGLANMTNAFTSSTTLSNAETFFAGQGSILVRDDVFANAGVNGTAGSSDFRQIFGLEDGGTGTSATPTAIPSPTAALGGLALLGFAGLRRRRG